ncbi:galectin-8 isoform X2 [Lepisosteus oculatus]|uniref:Galectin n=1 Tax=Lepisosteus oculatus TaxID=7918 RepID=W5NJK6_LEPOC|nr:PREDICTED: galectin-8 isoform X2 [Lepisosteus oculatus]
MSVTSPRQTVLNPAIPYAGTILGGLHPGDMVLIQGAVLSDADRFQVDFMCGSSTKPRADVAFHFNPRFKRSPCVVCNSLQQERWGKEEILYDLPLQKGENFETIILVEGDMFKVALNGKHLLQYNYRVDLKKVDTLGISGKVKIEAIAFVSSSEVFCETGDLSLPYRASLVNGVAPGQSITIKGQVSAYPHSFSINLRSGESSDIALHLNPRLRASVFVRNSFLQECWGPEENSLPTFPFSAGEYFEMIIFCEPQQFKVAVNGVHLLDYKHRVQDLSRIDQLEIMGDLQLLDVKLVK